MDQPEKFRAGPTDFLAAERTFLAWIRTGLALMAMGFVLARFGLFLQEFKIVHAELPIVSSHFSLWFGTILIVVGALVCLLSLWRYLRLIRKMQSGERIFDKPSTLAVGIAIFLALLGLAMSYYLLASRSVSARPVRTQEVPMPSVTPALSESGIVRLSSQHPVQETVAKLEAILKAKNVKLFTIIDHSGEAEKVGLKMPNTKLLIFGNPKGGTPLMVAAPSVALDLPLKILVAEDAQGKVWVSYNSPKYLQERHQFPEDLLPSIGVIAALAGEAAKK